MLKIISRNLIPPKRGPGPIAKEFEPVLRELRAVIERGLDPYEAVLIDVPVVEGIKQATATLKFGQKVKELIKDEKVPYQMFFRTDPQSKQKNLYIVRTGAADLVVKQD